MKIRTRYAPSPTGFFHVGGARTALFNYLYAKHNNGDFILRIEDTDIERNVEGGIDSQIDNLTWMGIRIDESLRNPGKFGPYQQSKKLSRYKELAEKLLKEKKAYRCFCTQKELDDNRKMSLKNGITPKYNRHCLYLSDDEINAKLKSNIPYVIRLKIQDNTVISWDDIIRGKISVPTKALTDPVIFKSNNYPMYNFGVVVDDHDMQITHVLRGEEHISNTPYQIAIKNALGWANDNISYGHLSVITNQSGKKLSKRDNTLKQFIHEYKQMGFVSHAIVNFLALLGWSPFNNQEIMTMQEMITNFEIKKVSHSPAVFDFKKMMWINNKYFNKMSDDEYLEFVNKFVDIDFKHLLSKKNDILLLFKKQLSYASELNDLINKTFFSQKNPSNILEKLMSNTKWKQTIIVFENIIRKIDVQISFDVAKQIINDIKLQTGNNGPDLYMPIRILLTNCEHGPELNKIISILGKENIISLFK